MIFLKQLRGQGHTRSFVVGKADDRGWEILEQEDNRVVKRSWLHDWHRVENAILRFTAEAVRLRDLGWSDVPTSSSMQEALH